MAIVRRSVSALRFVGAYMAANVQAAMEYRVAFIVQVLTMAANDGLWLFFWWTYFQQFPLTNGWQLTDVVIVWAVSAGGFGLSMGFFGNARQLATLINNGGLDAYLGMPRYALLHICIAASDPNAWGDIIFSSLAFVLLLHPDIFHIALFLLLMVPVSLIFTAFIVIVGSLAFFLGNTEGLAQQMLGALVSFSTYPMNIFNGMVRVLLFTIVPAGFVSFVPLQLLHQVSWPLVGAMLGGTVMVTGIAVGLFEWGVRRYESGNLLGMQN